MPSKIIRDPLYNYISLDLEKNKDAWLLKLLDTPPMQRLRRIHQLGVSYLTYPGADHNRLAHSLGVLHLMFEALKHIREIADDIEVNSARAALLATALIHDVGHGPFSHVFEPCLGIDHEEWSIRIVLEDTEVNEILRGVEKYLPQKVADLINGKNHDHPPWQKFLLSSQLDVDRLDYLRRDSLFTGAGFGHFDWFRLLNTFVFHEAEDGQRSMVWPEKSALAIEEYIFARYHMYQNVYLHKTTRGFERMIVAMWQHARRLHDNGTSIGLVAPIRSFWKAEKPSIEQYLAIEESTVLFQIQQWAAGKDKVLANLARRFLDRKPFVVVDPPPAKKQLATAFPGWREALCRLVASKGFDPPEMYCLEDTIKAKYNLPYIPEKEGDEQTVKNSIRILRPNESQPIEIVKHLPRLEPLTAESTQRVRFYVPKEVRAEALKLTKEWKEEE